MNKNLENLEAQLREIFEEKLFRLIPGLHSRRQLFDDLLTAMQDNLGKGPEGEVQAPDNLLIFVPGEDLSDWKAHQDVLEEMSDFLFHAGMSQGYTFKRKPTINLRVLDNAPNQRFVVSANISKNKPNLPDTAAMPKDGGENHQAKLPDHAFLIVGGRDNFPLDKPVVNIGRHSDNDLILDEPHVSRHHAQLRAINNRFVIFDVGSTGGLLINGKNINQATLQPGDVIRIGLVNLIFVQDATSEHPTTAIPVEENPNQDIGSK